MTKLRLLLLLLLSCCCAITAPAQKTTYIPAYLLDPNDVNGAQFSWNKTYADSNFILIWGNTVGTNPATYPDPSLSFNPQQILDTMEYIYSSFRQLGFLNDSPGTHLHQYKVPIIMYNTWGPSGAMGWANGGDADGVIGAFWVHPMGTADGAVIAHEFTHSLQAETVIDYRTTHGLGSVWDHAGIFWETHANFMSDLLYPKNVTAWGMDVYHTEAWGDWKNTYENYPLLFAIQQSEGIGTINRLWRESYSGEYPLQAYKRLRGYSQSRFNDSMYRYARRMATYDFSYPNAGNYFRQYRSNDLAGYLPTLQSLYSILRKIPGSPNRYTIPTEQAPEEYGYNIIPLQVIPDSCAVIVKFKGHTEANGHAGWRYGFVTANANGLVSRYSQVYSAEEKEIAFELQANESKMYLVVMGAPYDMITTDTSNDTWHGYPKHFRFPYDLTISGAWPEGYQDAAQFRAQWKTNGHIHGNGGGWIANTATVAPSVYVGAHAMVLGNATLSGNVRIDSTAVVRDATLGGNVQVRDNAFIDGGIYTGNAVIGGQAFAEKDTVSGNALIHMRARVSNYKLGGSAEVGGDVVVYNNTGNCTTGVYYTLTNYYANNLLPCDNRTASHPSNQDVNNLLNNFTDTQMGLGCNCSNYPGCLSLAVPSVTNRQPEILAGPDPATDMVTFTVTGTQHNGITEIFLYDINATLVSKRLVTAAHSCTIDVSALPSGTYIARVRLDGKMAANVKVVVMH